MAVPPDLSGKTALVTGSSRGIGRAIAQRLASAGATVAVTGRSLDVPVAYLRSGDPLNLSGTLNETVEMIAAAGGKAIAVAADLENERETVELVARASDALGGGVDILVNNAGFVDFSPVETMALATFDRTFAHYLRAPFLLSQSVLPQMRRAGSGWIVNIGSQDALPPGRPYAAHEKVRGYHVYAAAKAAMARLTQGMAAELVDANIAVNMVAPSTAIRTPGADSMIPPEFPTEDVAYLAETVLAMCHLPAADRTGLVAFSMHFPWDQQIEVRSLDGRSCMPRQAPPAWSHPAISPSGK